MANLTQTQKLVIIGLVLWLLFNMGGGGGGGVAPIPEPGFRVVIVEETLDRNDRAKVTAGQFDILTSNDAGSVREYIASHAVKRSDGSPDVLYVDPTLQGGWDKLPKYWQDALKRERKSVPWMIASNPGKGGYEGVLPDGREAALKILKPLGGP